MARKLSKNYFKKSTLKCLEGYVSKRENENLMTKSKPNQSKDFIPVHLDLFRSTKSSKAVRRPRKRLTTTYDISTTCTRRAPRVL